MRAQEEIERVVPLVARLAELGALVSVDTYKPAVAEAAVAAGAVLVNDISGLRDPALADVCARTGAALVVMHTRVAPKGTLLDPARYDDVVADVARLPARADRARAGAHGVADEQIVLDPGPTSPRRRPRPSPCCGGSATLHALGRPLLLAVSRKDFVGAITGRGPRERLAGHARRRGARASTRARHILRVHDVAAAADFLAVRAALRGERELDAARGSDPGPLPAR